MPFEVNSVNQAVLVVVCSHDYCSISGVSMRVLVACCLAVDKNFSKKKKNISLMYWELFLLEHDVALSSVLVAMYSTVASDCLYNAWPDSII